MKDLIDAINTRVKEPYWGFFLLSFLAFNWRALFLLCFAKGTAQEKIFLFDDQTTFLSLIVFPIITAVAIMLVTPWLKVLFGLVSGLAYEKLNSQELAREHKYIAEKNKLEQERTLEIANKEKDLIDKAKRDADIETIEHEEVKENLKKDIEELRVLKNAEKEILQAASMDKNGQIIRRTFIGGRFIQVGNLQLGTQNNMEFLKYDEALNSLRVKGLIQDVGQKGEIFEISYKGWEFISKFGLDK
ncbi:hypothetical protein [Acinetobacter sp. YH16032]|uniref:hypothetical protein n=1 Tax=Acinetobacter sp. YH16032 TaxID=2601181 RepID=UPI0015D22B4D|nr:hypothetical protein [Acinetobacter sp. YH16032]